MLPGGDGEQTVHGHEAMRLRRRLHRGDGPQVSLQGGVLRPAGLLHTGHPGGPAVQRDEAVRD